MLASDVPFIMRTDSNPPSLSSSSRLVLIVVFIVFGATCFINACCPFLDTWARGLCALFAGVFLFSTLVVVVGFDAVREGYDITKPGIARK